jgi:hypothetical protein
MADTDLQVTGKNTSIRVVQNGTIVQIQDRVTNFTRDLEVSEVDGQYLGQTGRQTAQEFLGNKGTLEIEESTNAVGEFEDTIVAAMIARTPLVINIVDTTYYNDGTSVTYTYPDCKLTFGRRGARGEATKTTITWKNGKPRQRM